MVNVHYSAVLTITALFLEDQGLGLRVLIIAI